MNKEEFKDPQFKKLLQIGIIVRDVEACVRRFEQDFGMGPWEIMVMGNEVPVFREMTINEDVTDFKIKVAMCSCFGMEFELVEPISDSPYKSWLETHGPGLHHLAFLTRDKYEDLLDAHQATTGKKPWVRGECKALGMDFSYLDLAEELGFIAEVYGMDKSKQPGHEF